MNAYQTNSEADSREFAHALGEFLQPGDTVLLSGDLGTGKSVIARGLAGALGVSCPMPSPSFPIMIPYQGREKVFHFDLYRLNDPEEFYAAGLDEFLGGDGVSIVEWPEMGDIAPDRYVDVRLSRDASDDGRNIVLNFVNMESAGKILPALERWRKPDEYTGH